MKRYYALMLSLTSALTTQAQLLNETFDSAAGFTITDGNDVSATFFSDGAGDYFGIFDGDSDGGADFGAGSSPNGTESYTGFDDNYLVNEDMDGDGTVIPYTLTWSGISLSGETSLSISADFASTRADTDDYIVISYRVDAGAWIEILGVAGASGTNGPVYEITDFVAQNGDASATAITAAFTNVSNSFSLAGTETTIDIKAEFSNNNGDDNFAMDNLIVEELTGIQPPSGLSATAGASPNNKDSLSVTFTPDGSNDVLLVYSTVDTFGTPVDTTVYSSGDSIPGGGTVAGVFSSSPASITGLVPGTIYYVAAYSLDGSSNNYSSVSSSTTGTTDSFAIQTTGFGGWTAVSVASTNDWSVSANSASASGFGGDAPAEDWLISPVLDLDASIDEKYEFTYEDGFDDTITGLEFFYTTAYTGDPSTTTWLPFTAINTELDNYVASGSGAVDTAVDLSAISGTTIQLAFKYTSTGTVGGGDTRNWTVSDPLFAGNNAADPAITLSATPTSVDEGTSLAVTLTLPSNVGADTEFFLSSNGDGTELSFPASVTVLSGTASIGFNVDGLTDGIPDNDQIVALTANATAYTLDTLDVTVTDVDIPDPSGDLIISQYYEGSGSNKYIEVTNIGASPIDLTGYTIVRWGNTRAEEYKTATAVPVDEYDSLDLSSLGTIQPDQTLVFANSDAISPIPAGSADLSLGFPGPFTFNGNDSIVIYNSATPNPANIVDAIGFTAGGFEGSDTSFVRASAFQGYNLEPGSNASSALFATIWTEVSIATTDAATYGDNEYIGTTALATAPTVVNFADIAIAVTEDGVSADLTIEISNPDGANSVSVDVVFNSGSSTADTADIDSYTTQTVTFLSTAVTGDQQTVTVTITDDGDNEGNEEAIFDLLNLITSNTNAQIGAGDTATLTIQDNDVNIPDLIISEIADPNDNLNARFVELYNPTGSTIDLDAGSWHLTRFVNANSSNDSVALTGSIAPGGTYIIAGGTGFSAYSPVTADLTSGIVTGNGDDTYAIYFGGDNTSGTLVDIYGVIGIDGTNQTWEYEDGRAVRNADITAPNATLDVAEWTINSDAGTNPNGIANVADMTPGVHPDPLVAAPTGVSASTVSDTEISVAFTAVDSNDVIIVFDTDGTFTAPAGAAPSVSDSFAGGTVLYVGQASPFAHTGLTADTQYFYAVFSVNGTDYSSTVEVDATTQVAGLIYSEDFNDPSGDADDWFNATVLGADPWDLSGTTATVDGYAGFVDNGAENHYLVSPALDFSIETAITISFDYEGAYDDGDADSFELVYSLDYIGSGNPEAAATWTEIPFDFSQNLQTGDPVALVNSGMISLPGLLEGEGTVHLAFRYSAGGGELDSELWELDNILIQSTTVAPDPLADYLTLRGLVSGDLGTDTNGNGFTVLEEYLAGYGDGSGPDAISYGIDIDSTLALTLTSDLELEPDGIAVVLEATSDLGVAFAPVAFTTSVVDNLDGTFTRSYTETTPPAGDQRFLRLSIIEE